VGAGLGGLSAAIRLAVRGWKVRVYEQQRIPGGKAGTESFNGYRFDTGPSLLTMPHVFDQLFSEAGRNRSDYLSFVKLDPICRYFWSDGSRLDAPGDLSTLPEAVREATGEPAENVRRYLEHAQGVHDTAAELFLWNSLHDTSTYRSRLFRKSLLRIGRIDALRSLDSSHRRFFRDARVVQLFNRYATYNGSNPYRTPATMSIIPFVEYAYGGYAVVDGIHEISVQLTKLARETGAEVFFSRKVDRIAWKKKGAGRRVTGIELEGGEIVHADIVVSNVDVSVAYPSLLGDRESRQLRRYHRLEPSSSGLVFYWGMNRVFDELAVNNIFFSNDYPAEFESIFDKHECPTEPTIYVNVTAKVSPDDAPRGCENWFVLVNAPATNGQDWRAETDRVRKAVVRRLSDSLGDDLGSCIAAERVLTPPEIEVRTGSHRGALYGISSNSATAAFARHPNRSRKYRGLYFTGGSVHPGGGMPLVILSGKIAADLASIDNRDTL